MTERLRELNFEELKKLYAGRMQNDFPLAEIKPATDSKSDGSADTDKMFFDSETISSQLFFKVPRAKLKTPSTDTVSRFSMTLLTAGGSPETSK